LNPLSTPELNSSRGKGELRLPFFIPEKEVIAMIFNDVIKFITRTVYDKVITKTDKIVSELEGRANRMFATKKELSDKIGEVADMQEKNKKFMLDELSTKATVESLVGLANMFNERLNNVYVGIASTNQKIASDVNNVKEEIGKLVTDSISTVTEQIIKTSQETEMLKTVVSTIVPQVVNSFDSNNLAQMIEAIVASEIEKLNATTPDSPSDVMEQTEEFYGNFRFNNPIEDKTGFQFVSDGYSFDIGYRVLSGDLAVKNWLPSYSYNNNFINASFTGAGVLEFVINIFKDNNITAVTEIYSGTIGSSLVSSSQMEYVVDNNWLDVDVRSFSD
jgi:hypothetical protein